MSTLAGVFAAIVTPFRVDGTTIDYAWIPYFLTFLRQQGVDGIVPMGTTGEGPSLSVQERQAFLDTIMARRGAFRVVPGVGTPSLTETIRLVRHAFASGADSVLVLPPYYWRSAGDQGLLSYFRTLCDKALEPGQGILLYHIPQVSGVPITLNLLDGLMETHRECIVGLKDSTGNPASFVEYMRRYPSLQVFVGNDRLAGLAYHSGAAGTITATANLVPGTMQRLRAQALAGEDYAELQEQLTALRDLLGEFVPIQAAIKTLLSHLADLPPTYVRPPLTNLSPHQRVQLVQAAQYLPVLQDMLARRGVTHAGDRG